MPIYEYSCRQCGAEFELLIRNAGTQTPPVCPECGSGEIARKLSRFATTAPADGLAPRCAGAATCPDAVQGGGCCGGCCGGHHHH